ncbi:MAG: NUDIX domain-containing protein [Chloroflexota bacterium]
MADYIRWIRNRVGHQQIFLNFATTYVTDEQGRYLLQKRSATEEWWGLPGGAMELGESAEEAAIREFREETGLDIAIDHMIGVYTQYFETYPNGDQAQPVVIAFKGHIVGGNLAVDHKETHDLRYFAPDQLPKIFNQQMQDIMNDILADRSNVYR